MKHIGINELPNYKQVIVLESPKGWYNWNGKVLTLIKRGTALSKDGWLFTFYLDNVISDGNYRSTIIYENELAYFKFVSVEDYEKIKAFL